MAKFSKDGYKIEVVENLKSGRYLVRRIFSGVADGWDDECEYPGGELSVVDAVFDHAPTQKLEAIVAGLREQIKNLQHEKANLAQEIRDTEEAGRAKLARYKKYDQLKTLDMFLDGKITHYVLEYWGSFKIISFEDVVPDERYDKDQIKLLTLFGKSNGNLEWGLSKYSDGSGCNTTVTPCVSYEEALSVAQKFVDSKMNDDNNYWSSQLIKEATIYSLKIDPEYIRKYEEKEQARKDKGIKEIEEKLKKLRENV